MVLQLVIGLLVLAAASLLITQGRRRRAWSVLVLAGLCGGAWFLLANLDASADTSFIYQWLPYNKLKADINISSTLQLQNLFIPLIGILAMMVYINTISIEEQHSLSLNTLLLLNFVAFILMTSSRDFLQLMFAGCLFSVICFYIPDMIAPKKKIFIFNFLAEMAVFMALAIVYGKTQSVSLAEIPNFAKSGWHKDLVAGLLLFAIGSKCGLLLLNDHYFSLKDTSFNRILSILIFSVPLSGFVLLLKLHPLITASSVSANILPWWALASCVVGLLTALINNHLKSKAIALTLSVSALLIFYLYKNVIMFYGIMPAILSVIMILFLVLGLAFRLLGSENYFIKPAGIWHKSKSSFMLSLGFITILVLILSAYFPDGIGLIFVIALMLSLGLILRMIYFGKSTETTSISGGKDILLYLPLFLGLSIFAWKFVSIKELSITYILFIILLAAFLCVPVKWIMRLGRMKIWHNDILFTIYETIFISPLRFLGRILWLAFDVVVIERSILASVSAIIAAFVRILQKLQEPKTLNYVLGIGLGILLMLIYAGWYVYG